MRLAFPGFLTMLLLLSAGYAPAQQKADEAIPIGGLHRLQLIYYNINFSPEQRQRLNYRVLEFIFVVSAEGNAKLQKVNGINEADILDSLYRAPLPEPAFRPRYINGITEESLFIMSLSYPTFGEPLGHGYMHYKEPTLNDFEFLDLSGRMDFLIGGVGDVYAGNTSRYLKPGGGIKLDLLFTSRKGVGGGMAMSVFSSSRKKEYPITTVRPQEKSQTILMIGAMASMRLQEHDSRREVTLQLELNYAMQNIVSTTIPDDSYSLQANGFSPGIVINYSTPLGRDRLTNYYGRPALVRNKLNVHGALRPLFMDIRSTSGLIVEAGLSYRLQLIFVREFKLRTGFFD